MIADVPASLLVRDGSSVVVASVPSGPAVLSAAAGGAGIGSGAASGLAVVDFGHFAAVAAQS